MALKKFKTLNFGGEDSYAPDVSWEDLETKPFGETCSDTLTWTSSTCTHVCGNYVKISDAVPTLADVYKGGYLAGPAAGSVAFSEEDSSMITVYDDGSIGVVVIKIVPEEAVGLESSYGEIFDEAGVYIYHAYVEIITEFHLNDYTGFIMTKKIDESFIPNAKILYVASQDTISSNPYIYTSEVAYENKLEEGKLTKSDLIQLVLSGAKVLACWNDIYYAIQTFDLSTIKKYGAIHVNGYGHYTAEYTG